MSKKKIKLNYKLGLSSIFFLFIKCNIFKAYKTTVRVHTDKKKIKNDEIEKNICSVKLIGIWINMV